QYDYDVAMVFGFLEQFGMEKEVKVKIDTGHAVLTGHSFEQEIATAVALGLFGSVDANRNDYQSGWDTDQFPNNHPETALALYHILKSGGLTSGGFNFDAKLRRQSLDAEDLVAAHVGGMDVLARGLLSAAAMIEEGGLDAAVAERYSGWDAPEAQAMLTSDLGSIAERVEREGIEPKPRSGRQERLENLINRFV